MAQASQPPAETTALDDTWPWRCLGCEGTIFHDAVFCHDCRPAQLPSRSDPSRHPVGAFLDWIRREPYPTFLTKVTAVASLEVSLTALWLQLMLAGSVGIGRLPVVA